MNHLTKLVEEKIQEAMEKGEFNNLPGRGKPLNLEEDAHIPAELRMVYRMLKRANVPPEEVLMAKNIAGLQAKILNDPDLTEEERKVLKKRLMLLDLELNMKMERFRKQYGGF